MNVPVTNLISWTLVGVLWGCTNPLLRKGSAESEKKRIVAASLERKHGKGQIKTTVSFKSKIITALSKFRYIGVWLPYLLNQCGSILYYKVLADSDLTLAVPICNSMTLVFSIVTSFALGERVDKPLRATLGAALVMAGVGICISKIENDSDSSNISDQEL
jgi:uncharacterized membrane protein